MVQSAGNLAPYTPHPKPCTTHLSHTSARTVWWLSFGALKVLTKKVRVRGLNFRVHGLNFRAHVLNFRVHGLSFRVQGAGFRVWDGGCKHAGERLVPEWFEG